MEAMRSSNKCPVCRVVAVETLGPCPNGTMHVSTIDDDYCEGYNDCGVIIIRFESFNIFLVHASFKLLDLNNVVVSFL